MPKTIGDAGRPARTRAPAPMALSAIKQTTAAQTENKAPVPRPNPTQGKVINAFGSDPTKRYKVRYELRELDDLITSNDQSGAINPLYPKELQPRDRTRQASRMQVQRMAQNIVPEAYTAEFMSLDRGAPIIGSDNVVESGNGRTMALRAAQQLNPQGYDAYKQNLRETAAEKGINTAALDGFKNPVLVRVRVDETVDRMKFAQDANTAATLGYSETEKSRSDAGRISTKELLNFETTGENINQDLKRASNRDFVRSFVGTLPETERATVVDSSGQLTQAGQERVKAAMFTRVYDDDKLAGRIFESVDNDTKNITNGLMASLGRVAQTEEKIRLGERDKSLTISKDIGAAVAKFATLKESGQSIEQYLGQRAMFGDELNPTQKRILSALDERRRSGKAVADFINSYAEIVEREPDPRQMGFFGGIRRGRDEILEQWLGGQ